MKVIIGVLIAYILFYVLFLAVGLVVGLALHWLMPSVDFGMGILIGIVTMGISLHFGIQLVNFIQTTVSENVESSTGDFPPDLEDVLNLPRKRRKWRPK